MPGWWKLVDTRDLLYISCKCITKGVKMLCKKCGKPREYGRKLCKKCKAAEARERYRKKGHYNYGKSFCSICGDEITIWRKTQTLCKRCSQLSTSTIGNVTNKYERAGGGGYCFKHRRIAENILQRKLNSNEVVHHLDEDPMNNILSNLIVISRSLHGKLHLFLREQRAELVKANFENFENCWDNLRVPMTTAWLETAGAKVIKLWEIGQSAAEPRIGEGSETMHEAPYR